jgi:hypothetical protein
MLLIDILNKLFKYTKIIYGERVPVNEQEPKER